MNLFCDTIKTASGKHTARVYSETESGCKFVREHWVFDSTERGKRKAENKAILEAEKNGYILVGIKEKVIFT